MKRKKKNQTFHLLFDVIINMKMMMAIKKRKNKQNIKKRTRIKKERCGKEEQRNCTKTEEERGGKKEAKDAEM